MLRRRPRAHSRNDPRSGVAEGGGVRNPFRNRKTTTVKLTPQLAAYLDRLTETQGLSGRPAAARWVLEFCRQIHVGVGYDEAERQLMMEDESR